MKTRTRSSGSGIIPAAATLQNSSQSSLALLLILLIRTVQLLQTTLGTTISWWRTSCGHIRWSGIRGTVVEFGPAWSWLLSRILSRILYLSSALLFNYTGTQEGWWTTTRGFLAGFRSGLFLSREMATGLGGGWLLWL